MFKSFKNVEQSVEPLMRFDWTHVSHTFKHPATLVYLKILVNKVKAYFQKKVYFMKCSNFKPF